mmetsp:Transcript_134993/g.234726  ORF Transcript_134993/g.234726 Transcript_134993/m.234726 type:complete len:131 (+) Transcript_134993:467-859(+)
MSKLLRVRSPTGEKSFQFLAKKPPAFPLAQEAIPARSTRLTGTSRRAKWYAIDTPITPPPKINIFPVDVPTLSSGPMLTAAQERLQQGLLNACNPRGLPPARKLWLRSEVRKAGLGRLNATRRTASSFSG